MSARLRTPSGKPAWPLILVEGEEKAGKSFTLAQLAASERVGRTFVWDLGDGTMDEYADLGRYEIVETNGTLSDLRESVREITTLPMVDGKPNVYGIDSGTDLWDLIKRWVDHRARGSKAGQKALRDDPDAEIDPSMNLWNDGKDRWSEIVNMLRRSPGIGVITAQGGEVVAMDSSGRPSNQKTWSVQAEKTLPRAVTAWVRVKREPTRTATLIGVRRLGLDIPAGGLQLPLEHTLDHLVFDVIGAGATFGATRATAGQIGLSKAKAMVRVLDAVRANFPDDDDEAAKAHARALWEASGIDDGRDEFTADDLVVALDLVVSAAMEATA